MIHRFHYSIMLAYLVIFPTAVWAQFDLQRVKSDYEVVTAQLEKHLVSDSWIDDAPESPELLAQQWSLAGQWVAAWLNAHPFDNGPYGVKTALAELKPEDEPECLELTDEAFVVTAPGPIGNVFIVAKAQGQYRLAWSIAQPQESRGEQAEILAAWHAENARSDGRGPYWTASGSAGSVIPRLGILPADTKGYARFYIDGTYAQSAGGTVGAQISLWVWDGTTARLQIARDYNYVADQAVRTRLQGGMLRVQQKKSFRTFFSCGMCEERQTDWIVRLAPDGVEDLGEESTVPELDAVDELFHRVIHHQPVADIAAPSVLQYAERVVQETRQEHSPSQWKKFPSLGMMGTWTVQNIKGGKVLCFGTDDIGSSLFTLKAAGAKLFISEARTTESTCER